MAKQATTTQNTIDAKDFNNATEAAKFLKELQSKGYKAINSFTPIPLEVGNYAAKLTGSTSIRPLAKKDKDGNPIVMVLAQVEVSVEGRIERFNATINESDLHNCVAKRSASLEVSTYQPKDKEGQPMFENGIAVQRKGAKITTIA